MARVCGATPWHVLEAMGRFPVGATVLWVCCTCDPAMWSPAHRPPVAGSPLVGFGHQKLCTQASQRAAGDVAELVGSCPCSSRTSATEQLSLAAAEFCQCFPEAVPEHLWKARPWPHGDCPLYSAHNEGLGLSPESCIMSVEGSPRESAV